MAENSQFELLWKRISETLEAMLSPITYNTYISKLTPVDVDDTKIVLSTDNEFFANFIGKNLTDKMKEAFRKADRGITDFAIVLDDTNDVVYTTEEDDEDYSPLSIDPRFTFESFVAGKSNEFVFAAAKAVAKNPGANFNPLYIYGASGLGKTHLMQSIANYINLHKPSLRVMYTTCEKFINELIDSIYLNKGNNRDLQARFRNRYRNVDVLLITCSSSPKNRRCRKSCSTPSTPCRRTTNRSCSPPTFRPRRSQRWKRGCAPALKAA